MIYIVRHGKTSWNEIGRIQGHADVALNKDGIEEAKKIKDNLKDIRFDLVISSPLKRALRTAKIISGYKYKDIIIDNRIIERCNGEFEGKLKNEIFESIDFNDPNEKRYGIENIIDFRKRINNFCEEIKDKYKNKNILVVTHAGVSIYMRCYFEGEPQNNDYMKYKLKNCEVIKYNNEE
jgi:broad specificity phosphatase PhoE